MTYREHRLRKAERLHGWAEKRGAKAATVHQERERYHGDIAFWTQPGRIPERDRVHARGRRAWEHDGKARDMNRRAAGIEAGAERAIYSDDPDACEQLQGQRCCRWQEGATVGCRLRRRPRRPAFLR
ncbi:hypothetical protein LCGC14_1905810 [marine sediment metagenome]|uniref:Uncharacterized protein n=1 Tax=marine sediment metagenome TaxID=412755 RepID=A0A0F9FVM0_9ZZZZ